MRIKVLSRSKLDNVKERATDVDKIHTNLEKKYHPFPIQREYVRALNATKLERVFAKPFVGDLNGHSDGVWCTATSPSSLVQFLSGSCDGEVRVWDIPSKRCMYKIQAHKMFVRGIVVDPSGKTFYTCSDDKTIKRYRLSMSMDEADVVNEDYRESLNEWRGKDVFYSIDHSRHDENFVTCGSVVNVWSPFRQDPIHQYAYGTESLHRARYHPAEEGLLATLSSERSICLYDIRSAGVLRKVQLSMSSNDLAWNPREPMYFTVANEDFHLYSFDMRNLEKPVKDHVDHVGAVMSIAYSPAGNEFVSGSYDRTVRIWDKNSHRSREVYHTKRMQRVFCVNYSADSHFVLSGSSDSNIRIWKSEASKPLYKPTRRQEEKLNYSNNLKKKYGSMPEISRISRHRHLPKTIMKMKQKEEGRKKKDVSSFDVVE